jgi:hypothetical protein
LVDGFLEHRNKLEISARYSEVKNNRGTKVERGGKVVGEKRRTFAVLEMVSKGARS